MGAAGRFATAGPGVGNDAAVGTRMGCSAAASSSSDRLSRAPFAALLGRPAARDRAAFDATSVLGRARARTGPGATGSCATPGVSARSLGVGRAAFALARTCARARR